MYITEGTVTDPILWWQTFVVTQLKKITILPLTLNSCTTQQICVPDMCKSTAALSSTKCLFIKRYWNPLRSEPPAHAGVHSCSETKGQRVKLQFGPHSWSLKQSRWVKMENWPGDQMRSDNQKLHIDTNKVQNNNFDKYYVPCSFNIKKSRQAIVMPLINLSHPHRSSHPYLQCLTKAQTSQTSLV